MFANRTLYILLNAALIGCEKSGDSGSNPDFILAGQTNDLTHISFANDSILSNAEVMDLNNDAQGDFLFSYYFQQMTQAQCDSFVSACPPPQLCDCFPSYTMDARIQYLPEFRVVRHTDNYKPYPLPLELNDTISKARRWHEAYTGIISYAQYGTGVKGLWPFDDYKYLGFRWIRTDDMLFGWVRMKYKNGNLLISDLAYQE